MKKTAINFLLYVFLGTSACCAVQASSPSGALGKAIFAGGCFWCVESAFEKHEGVIDAVSGYTNGQNPNPTYKQVSSGRGGHLEAVEVLYDPKQISYRELLEIFWREVDPTDDGAAENLGIGRRDDGQVFFRGADAGQEKPGLTQGQLEIDLGLLGDGAGHDSQHAGQARAFTARKGRFHPFAQQYVEYGFAGAAWVCVFSVKNFYQGSCRTF